MKDDKHPDELPDDILKALGFKKTQTDGYTAWTHKRGAGKLYFHILDASSVSDALIQVGHQEFRRRAEAEIASIDID